MSAVDACRWSTKSIPYAPYVTSLPWISHYGCQYVVHGDDITSDSAGEDCYRFVKAAGRFLVVKRTPGISTTDLVGRMLLCTKNHFIKSLTRTLMGAEGPGSPDERSNIAQEMSQRIKDYASDETGRQPGACVLSWNESASSTNTVSSSKSESCRTMVDGVRPRPGQRIVYVDGGFDLFSSGHIEFLRQVVKAEEALGRQNGWYDTSSVETRCATGESTDYGPAYIVAGVHDDETINHWKGVNYPIMNTFERGLCVLQCRVCVFSITVSSLFLQTAAISVLIRFSTFTLLSFPLPLPLQRSTLPISPLAPRTLSITGLPLSCHSLTTHTLAPRI